MITGKNVNCKEYKVDDNHNILVLERGDLYDFYLMEVSEPLGTPYQYMFGLPIEQQPYEEAVEIAIANAPDYYDMFEE